MNEAEKMKFRLSAGREEVDRRISCNFTMLTIDGVNKFIDNKDIDDTTKQKLKKMANNYPFQALGTFLKNIDKNIAKIRKEK